ncbi:MAG: CNNM domain-containing protein, partial [Bacteroidota bacterium]
MSDTIVLNIPYSHLLTISRQGISLLTVILTGLFFLSFIAGGARLALFSLKQKDINYLKLKTDENARRIIRLLEHPRLILYTMITAQIMLNTAIIIIANYMMDALLDFRHPIPVLEFAVKILLITFVILLVNDLIPKIWAHHHTHSFLYFSSWWLEAMIVPLAKFPAIKMLDIINK